MKSAIAVVGAASLLPGADGLDEFWELLKNGRDAIVEFPPERLNRKRYYDPKKSTRCKTYSTLGGLVPERDMGGTDERLDLSHQLFCSVAEEACRHAGLEAETLGRMRVGVYVGHSAGTSRSGELALATLAEHAFEPLQKSQEFQCLGATQQRQLLHRCVERLRKDRPRREPGGGPWLDPHWAAQLVSKRLGLSGPSLVVDAACASSLVSLTLGAIALQSEDVEVAIVGGASNAKTESLVLFSQAQSCSATGSRPFDEKADGLIGAEGYVALVLKTEARARRDGDEIMAVVRGIGLSSDGRGRSLWAPAKEGQMKALERAYADHDPTLVQYIEAHATSTQLGDATELNSLGEFFRTRGVSAKIPVGSVKSNLGHCLESAGLASLLKVILSLQHNTIPPTIHVHEPNRSVDWETLPLSVASEARPWPVPDSGKPRTAGVSAFGIGGLNVHLVVEEPSQEDSEEKVVSTSPVAIVGRGVILPGAHNVKALKQLLAEEKNSLSEAPQERSHAGLVEGQEEPEVWTTPTSRGGFIREFEYDCLAHKVPPKQVARANPLQFMFLEATHQAFQEAGEVERAETAVVVGAPFVGDFSHHLLMGLRFPELAEILQEKLLEVGLSPHQTQPLLDSYEELFFERYPALLDETGSFTSSTLASRVTKAFDLEGGALAIDSSDCSSSMALATGCDLLRAQLCSTVVCAGGERAMDLVAYESLSMEGRFRDSDYFPGEGVVVLLLQRLEDAQRSEKRVFGILHGEHYHHQPEESGQAALSAAKLALGASEIEASEVSEVVVSEGPGAASGQELVQLYDGSLKKSRLSSLVGDLRGVHGLAMVASETLAPSRGLKAVSTVTRDGRASHVLLSNPAGKVKVGRRLRIGAQSWSALKRILGDSSRWPDQPFEDTHCCRLAILAEDPTQLKKRRTLAIAQLDHSASHKLLNEQGIYWQQQLEGPPRLAFMFSGQGSQRPGMLRDLCQRSPAARETLRKADLHLAALGQDSFAKMAWEDPQRLNEDPVSTQVAVLIADLMVYAAACESGLEADCVAGHSFGEIPAMVAARVLTLEQAIRLTTVRAQALQEASPNGGLLSVQGGLQEFQELLQQHQGKVFLTHQNTHAQTVVGGRTEDLETFAHQLAERGLKSRALRVPGALHTPLVEDAQPVLEQLLQSESLALPTKLFYSNVTNQPVSEPDDFRTNLVSQLVEPLDYIGLIQRMCRDGVTAFLEIGPGRVLTGLHGQLLEGMSPRVVCTSLEHPQRSSQEQFERAHLMLECAGVLIPDGKAPTLQGALGCIKEFDATAGRRKRKKEEASRLTRDTPQADAPLQAQAQTNSELAQFLIDFVVEFTGYPPEVIDLDWDLEADLGIDSIKRTQLLGEVAEVFEVQPPSGTALDLDSFRTLRQLMEFLQDSQAAAPGDAGLTQPQNSPDYARGQALGRQFGEPLRALLREEALHAFPQESAQRLRDTLSPSELSELEGWAHGAGLHPAVVIGYRARGGELPKPVVESAQTHRYLLQMRDCPLPEDGPSEPMNLGHSLILGEGPWAKALAGRLQKEGREVHQLAQDGEELAKLEALWELAPLPHLFLVPATQDGQEWSSSRRQRVLWSPFKFCQRWLSLLRESGSTEDATLVGVTSLGGDFGFSGQLVSYQSASLSGLFKAITIESWLSGYRHLPVKVVDAAPSEPAEQVAQAVLAELANPSYECEIGIQGGRRMVVRPERADLAEGAKPSLSGSWICTGGARGITAFVASELGRRYGLTLHLLGRAIPKPAPLVWRQLWSEDRRQLKRLVMDEARGAGENSVRAWEEAQKQLEILETLENLKTAGVQASYHSCDVSDRQALAEVLDTIRQSGPIEGILHGAGASRDAKFEQKEDRRVDQCFRAKVDGTLALMELTLEDPVKHFVAFGSISGRFGANGHADYSLANDMMAKLVSWYRRRRPEVAAAAFHWHAWGDVGMAVKAETQLGLQLVDMKFMTAQDGLRHLIEELGAGLPHSEVLITDAHYCSRFYPDESPLPAEDTVGPMLQEGFEHSNGTGRSARLTLDPVTEVFLREHRVDDRPVLPLVMSLELAAEAAQVSTPVCFRSIEAHTALKFHADQSLQVKVEASHDQCLVSYDFKARDGTLLELDRPVLQTVVQKDLQRSPTPRVTAAPAGPWQKVPYQERGSKIYHGPSLRALRKWCLDESGCFWGRLIAPASVELGGTARPTAGWRVPCALLDGCLFGVGMFSWSLNAAPTLPGSIEELIIWRSPRPRENCLLKIEPVAEQRFNFCLYGSNGQPLLEAHEYALVTLKTSGELVPPL